MRANSKKSKVWWGLSTDLWKIKLVNRRDWRRRRSILFSWKQGQPAKLGNQFRWPFKLPVTVHLHSNFCHVWIDSETRFHLESLDCLNIYTLVPVNLDKVSDVTALNDTTDHICDHYAPMLNQVGKALKPWLFNVKLLIKHNSIMKSTGKYVVEVLRRLQRVSKMLTV